MAFDWIPILGTIDKTVDIVEKSVVDKDEQIKVVNALKELKEYVYCKELETKTIPWVDGLHKLGRQIGSFAGQVFGFIIAIYALSQGDAQTALLSAGGTHVAQTAYNIAKGKGNKE